MFYTFQELVAGADPGFPVGGHGIVSGGVDLQRRRFSVKMYVKTKELGPVGGGGDACAGKFCR